MSVVSTGRHCSWNPVWKHWVSAGKLGLGQAGIRTDGVRQSVPAGSLWDGRKDVYGPYWSNMLVTDKRERDTEREREKETDRQGQRHRQRDSETQRQTERDRDRETQRQRQRKLFTRVTADTKTCTFYFSSSFFLFFGGGGGGGARCLLPSANEGGHSRPNNIYIHAFLSYYTLWHTLNKWTLDIQHEMGMEREGRGGGAERETERRGGGGWERGGRERGGSSSIRSRPSRREDWACLCGCSAYR